MSLDLSVVNSLNLDIQMILIMLTQPPLHHQLHPLHLEGYPRLLLCLPSRGQLQKIFLLLGVSCHLGATQPAWLFLRSLVLTPQQMMNIMLTVVMMR